MKNRNLALGAIFFCGTALFFLIKFKFINPSFFSAEKNTEPLINQSLSARSANKKPEIPDLSGSKNTPTIPSVPAISWQATQWFVPPVFASEGRFKKNEFEVHGFEGCNLGTPHEGISFQDFLGSSMGIEPELLMPEGPHIVTLTQNWTDSSGQYFQISMNDQQTSPATYELTYVSATNPLFAQNVQFLTLPQDFSARNLSSKSSLSAISKIYRDAKNEGATGGARTMSLRVQDNQGALHNFEILNSTILEYSDKKTNCFYNNEKKQFNCFCRK